MKRFVWMFVLPLTACGGPRAQEGATAPASTAPVVVPEAPAAAERDPVAPPARPPVVQREVEESDDGTAGFEVEVHRGQGRVRIKSAPDAGVKVWGSFNRTDGGFTFQGGFSTGNADAGS